MPSGTITTVVASGGITLNNPPVTETGDNSNNYVLTLPAGSAGTLSTRTTDGSGVVTVSTGHGISPTDIFDIHWVGGGRYGITCDSSDATTITFDDTPAATGDVLPAELFAIVATEQIQVATGIDGDNVELFALHSDQQSVCQFFDTGDAVIKLYQLLVANSMESWYQSSAEANPLTGNPITYAMVSNGSTTAATMTILVLEDSTP